MANENELFSWQGRVFVGDVGGSQILNPVWVGDATMQIELATETAEHNESFSGQRLPYGRMQTAKSANVTLTLWEAKAKNLALALYGTQIATASGAVTDEPLPTVAAGDNIVLEHPMISALTLVDSAASPVTLVEGQHYKLVNGQGGLIEILDVAGLTQPILADYDYAAVTQTGMFTTTPPERWVKMIGVNTLNNAPVIVDLYRVRFDPASQLNLHHEEFGSFELSGSALVDSGKEGSALGGFGAVTLRSAL